MDDSASSVPPTAPPLPGYGNFVGKRGDFFRLLLGGYLLLIPTLGLARFWLTTAKRRFYWNNTVIGGDALEYTGNARQLLTGFLFALAFFLPIYLGLFLVALQSPTLLVFGYGGVGVVLWFLMGYAIYRGRDFRLSHTLWRGIRFGQDGNAWGYALRRFLWSLLVVLTLGLAYPFMMASLWRYRYRHTLYGDRRFAFTGSWRTIAGPFYRAWAAVAVLVGIMGWMVWDSAQTMADPFTALGSGGSANGVVLIGALVVLAALLPLLYVYFRSREASRMFSAVRLGEARIVVKVRARGLLMQGVLMVLALLGAGIAVGLVGAVLGAALGRVLGEASISSIRFGGAMPVAALVATALGYLASVGTFSLMGELFLDMGYWMLVARGATVSGIETLDDVRAGDEDGSVVGEGLADALNVGAF